MIAYHYTTKKAAKKYLADRRIEESLSFSTGRRERFVWLSTRPDWEPSVGPKPKKGHVRLAFVAAGFLTFEEFRRSVGMSEHEAYFHEADLRRSGADPHDWRAHLGDLDLDGVHALICVEVWVRGENGKPGRWRLDWDLRLEHLPEEFAAKEIQDELALS